MKIDKKMTKEEWHDWLELCEYVKLEILGYPDNVKFPQQLALRLMGLSKGNFIANKNIPENAKYDFKTMLYTFKVCKKKILDYYHNNQAKLKNESHKINIAMMFFEQEVNDVYMRLRQKEHVEEKIENVNLESQNNDSAMYKTKTVDVKGELKNLW